MTAAVGSRCFLLGPETQSRSGVAHLLPECHTLAVEMEFAHHIELKKPEVD
ncbi:hypothetical protein [Mesorhizobium sp. M1E.F.Ca.ET.063.01.1.1]|uniref:hypothetical protein n=1 Tax=Mesorhizobium sp. M1E.F.Ca.ET.063.01.1.1 TaxID=2496750 RepID=UPI0016788EA1|nr:hypothetical protein [Mesorhizobium sp. M1E.F.Ca.ET.063.01.1.1]